MSLLRRPLARALALALVASPLLVQAQTATKSATWWNPSEGGWGLFTTDQGSSLAAGWFTYDTDGEPTWYLLAGVAPQADGTYRGNILRYSGVPYPQIAGQAADPATVLGQGTLSFQSETAMTFAYTVNGQSVTKSLSRFNFSGKDLLCKTSAAGRASASNYSDLWYSPSASGWGLHVSHLSDDLYATWYTYDLDREAIFLIGALRKQADGSFSGPVLRQRNGTPLAQINGSAASPGSDSVGTATVRFSNGESGTFSYTVGNVTQSKPISRLQFGNASSVCEVRAYPTTTTPPPGGGSGQEECHPPYRIGDVRTLRDTSTANGQTTVSNFRETNVREATFNGHTGIMQEVDGQTSAGTGVYARNYVFNGNGTTGSLGAEGVNPASGQVISTSLNIPARVELQRSFTVGQTVPLQFKVNGTAQGFSTIIDVKTTYKLLGKESVTVPAGTFTACKFETTAEQNSSISGVTTRTQLSGLSWNHPTWGLLKTQVSGTSTISAFGTNQVTNHAGGQELVSARMNGQTTP
jgi:hypothetical protein